MMAIIQHFDPKRAYPVCLDGKRACPPEDCGGTWLSSIFSRVAPTPRNAWCTNGSRGSARLPISGIEMSRTHVTYRYLSHWSIRLGSSSCDSMAEAKRYRSKVLTLFNSCNSVIHIPTPVQLTPTREA